MALTERRVHELTTPGYYGDGANSLYLRVHPYGGSKTWVVRFKVGGKRVDRGLGKLKDVTLAEARKQAARVKAEAAHTRAFIASPPRFDEYGGEWVDARPVMVEPPPPPVLPPPGAAPTLREAARMMRDRKVAARELTSEKHARNWLQVLERHVLDVPRDLRRPCYRIGDKRLDELTQRDVLAVLEEIWYDAPETAAKVRGRLFEVFAWGMVYEYMTHNLADLKIAQIALGKTRKATQHFAAVAYADVPKTRTALIGSPGLRESRLALQWVMLTGCRSGEARGMRWGELDADWTTWTIPAERAKMRREHRVPVSAQARAVLRDARDTVAKRRKGQPASELVFPHPSGQPLSNAAMMLRLKAVATGATVHGFRTSLRTFLAERTDATWEAAELCIGHVVGSDVARAYMRSDLLDQRRELMQLWADHVQPA